MRGRTVRRSPFSDGGSLSGSDFSFRLRRGSYGRVVTVRRVVPVFTVTDLPAAVAAYTAVTGMRVVMDHGWVVTLADPDGGGHLNLTTGDATAPVDPNVSIEVDDLAAAHRAALAAGLPIVHGPADEPWGVRRFFYRDPAGTVVNVLTHR